MWVLLIRCGVRQTLLNEDAMTDYCAAPLCTIGECCKESGDTRLASAEMAVAEKKEAAETATKTELMKDLAAARVDARSHNVVAVMTLLLMSWWR